MASTAAAHLIRRALPKLRQGSTLEIRASIAAHLVLQPAWRDYGEACLEQTTSASLVDMTVRQNQENRMTSMGRLASHVSIDLKKNRANRKHDDVVIDSPAEQLPPNPNEETTNKQLSHEEATLTVQIPEKLNLICHLTAGGSIWVTSKVEGDAELTTTNGDIVVRKLRGHRIHLQNHHPSNVIWATEALEAAQLSVETAGGRVRAKRIHGAVVNVNVKGSSSPSTALVVDDKHDRPSGTLSLGDDAGDDDDEGSMVDISALFVSSGGGGQNEGGATIEVQNVPTHARRAVRIQSNHGPVQVTTRGVTVPTAVREITGQVYPLIELGGVNGSCEVVMLDTKLGDDDHNDDDDDWISCWVHVDSLSPESVSVVSTDGGHVSVTLDRKAAADLRLLSTQQRHAPTTTTLLADEENSGVIANALRQLGGPYDLSSPPPKNSDPPKVSVQTKAFTAHSQCESFRTVDVEYVEGFVENKSNEPDSRFERKLRGDVTGSIGKINLTSAADQALKGFVGSSDNDGSSADQSSLSVLRPLIAVVGRGRIVVETVSWLGAIARRYGLEENVRDVGRTAARRGRSHVPAPDPSAE